MVILVLGELLGAVGFCGAELFFVLGVVLRFTSRVRMIFTVASQPLLTLFIIHAMRAFVNSFFKSFLNFLPQKFLLTNGPGRSIFCSHKRAGVYCDSRSQQK
jgi:hypothetical protein